MERWFNNLTKIPKTKIKGIRMTQIEDTNEMEEEYCREDYFDSNEYIQLVKYDFSEMITTKVSEVMEKIKVEDFSGDLEVMEKFVRCIISQTFFKISVYCECSGRSDVAWENFWYFINLSYKYIFDARFYLERYEVEKSYIELIENKLKFYSNRFNWFNREMEY